MTNIIIGAIMGGLTGYFFGYMGIAGFVIGCAYVLGMWLVAD